MNAGYRFRQSGAVLFVSLILLLVLTLIGVTAMKTTSMQEKMAASHRQRAIAMQAAEAAIRQAEIWLEDNVKSVSDLSKFNGADELYAAVTSSGCAPGSAELSWDYRDPSKWSSTNSDKVAVAVPGIKSIYQPRYVIEYIGRGGRNAAPLNPTSNTTVCGTDATAPYMFRITALGLGMNGETPYLLQSHFYIPGPLK